MNIIYAILSLQLSSYLNIKCKSKININCLANILKKFVIRDIFLLCETTPHPTSYIDDTIGGILELFIRIKE